MTEDKSLSIRLAVLVAANIPSDSAPIDDKAFEDKLRSLGWKIVRADEPKLMWMDR